IKEYQRLKEDEQKQIGWSAKRELAKINYHIHTDAIRQNLIPAELSVAQTSMIYANEADVLNVALYGITAKQWRDVNPDLKGNIRDYSTINELICLSNMENINAVLINDGMIQKDRLVRLNKIAIQQMQVLCGVENRKVLK
ncbi:MAG: KilA-N domain-containing protein, partial [Odoribacter sp.]